MIQTAYALQSSSYLVELGVGLWLRFADEFVEVTIDDSPDDRTRFCQLRVLRPPNLLHDVIRARHIGLWVILALGQTVALAETGKIHAVCKLVDRGSRN